MSVQSDRWISARALQRRMIEPFGEKPVAGGAITHELASSNCGLCVSVEFKVFSKVNSAVIGPNAFDGRLLASAGASSVESFHIPKNVLTICVGKSAYARCGITREHNAIRAGAGERRSAGNLQRAAAIGQGLRQRRAVPEDVFPFRCAS
jgi:deoxycytidine triphosphate deaminase